MKCFSECSWIDSNNLHGNYSKEKTKQKQNMPKIYSTELFIFKATMNMTITILHTVHDNTIIIQYNMYSMLKYHTVQYIKVRRSTKISLTFD